MMSEKKQIVDGLTDTIKQLILVTQEYSMNCELSFSSLPTQEIETSLLSFLSQIVRPYKNDIEGLWQQYNKSILWREVIRKTLLMDDPEEKRHWFSHIYGLKPNKLFSWYMEEHFPIALEKVLEMFERGYRKDFLAFKFCREKIKNYPLFEHGINEILNIINERYENNRLTEIKATGKFFAWLYLLDKKRIETVLQEYESVVDDDLNTIAQICRETLSHEAPEQMNLGI